MIYYSINNIVTAVKSVATARAVLKTAKEGVEEAAEMASKATFYEETATNTVEVLSDITKGNVDPTAIVNMNILQPGVDVTQMGVLKTSPLFSQMKLYGMINENGIFQQVTDQI